MTLFLERIEPYILSDDIRLRDFALRSIRNAKLGNENTFHLILKAADKAEPEADAMINRVIPNASHITLTESMLKELITRIKKNDEIQVWYLTLVFNCDYYLLHKYRDELESYLQEDFMETAKIIVSAESEELLTEIENILVTLNKGQYLNQSLFGIVKKIYRELIRRGAIDQTYAQEIEVSLKEEMDKEYLSFGTILKIYVAGELKLTSLSPKLTELLARHGEDILLEEVTDALIKMASPKVIPYLEKYIQNEYTFYEAIDILKEIKDSSAKKVLLKHFDSVTNITAQTLIADALSFQLSVKSIPKVAALIESGYDTSTLDFKDSLYANCVINGVEYPKLIEGKAKSQPFSDYQNLKQIQSVSPVKKVGRNEPCTCGSGKKYKKCCGA